MVKIIDISEIKAGDIGLSGGSTFIQKAIAFFTKSDLSHSFSIGMMDNKLHILETTATKIHCVPLETKLSEPDFVEIWDVIGNEDDITQAFNECCLDYVGTWYGYLSYVWFIYRFIAWQLDYNPKTVWAWASPGTTCTELTCTNLMKRNGQLKECIESTGMDLSAIDPQSLKNIMIANPHLFRFKGYLVPKPT
jgi:hypothetical protein